LRGVWILYQKSMKNLWKPKQNHTFS
jgi:hypothetical protein